MFLGILMKQVSFKRNKTSFDSVDVSGFNQKQLQSQHLFILQNLPIGVSLQQQS